MVLLVFPLLPVQPHVQSSTEFSLPVFYTHGLSQPSVAAADVQRPVLQLLQRVPAGATPLGSAVIMSCAPVMQELVAQARASVLAADAPSRHTPVPQQPHEASWCNSAPLPQGAALQAGLLESWASPRA